MCELKLSCKELKAEKLLIVVIVLTKLVTSVILWKGIKSTEKGTIAVLANHINNQKTNAKND